MPPACIHSVAETVAPAKKTASNFMQWGDRNELTGNHLNEREISTHLINCKTRALHWLVRKTRGPSIDFRVHANAIVPMNVESCITKAFVIHDSAYFFQRVTCNCNKHPKSCAAFRAKSGTSLLNCTNYTNKNEIT
jgi:hypothetical protein